MKPYKKIAQKNQLYRWITVSAILFFFTLQFYALYFTYNSLSDILSKSVDDALFEAVKEYRSINVKNKKDPITISFNEKEKKNIDNTSKSAISRMIDYSDLNLSFDDLLSLLSD
ncbi:hypothetical protein [Williamwhitmania taraxaci]|uniref:Uncharacterized protein n=1 Tax=Williamwhitmania taraxaci TaxID=1640674 RepID=A0A1G6SNK8_9BACT|nr:hypothetical protein [Williamwhitmania taraxaci]SDD18459.1 hypothetical protein SAMN05216323_10982 [Williamwhitmania taraxaci]